MDPVVFFEEEVVMLIPALLSGVPSLLFSVAGYVLTSLALYTIARRRGLNNSWLSWVPVINCWIVGSLSDQYQYVVKGKNKGKRKILLILNVLSAVFAVTIAVLAIALAAGAIFSHSDAELMGNIMGPVMAILGMCLPLAGVGIAAMVIRYMAMFDIYRSLDPGNAVLFLVLSIFFGVTEPFFLFFNRNKDEGMPPRRRSGPEKIVEEAQWQPAEPEQEPWEDSNKDYL